MELGRDRIVREIISRLKIARGGGLVKVEGTWGSFAPLLAAYISKELGRPILYLRPHIDDADKAADDLNTFGAEDVEAFAAWEGEEDLADATDETRAERLKLVSRISSLVSRSGKDKLIIPASVQALCQPIPKPQALEASNLALEVGKNLSPKEAVGWLMENGFERVDSVDLPGQFAHRGGIVDVYAPLVTEENPQAGLGANQTAAAIRIEFFGDTIESIRQVNLDTQRSTRQIESVSIVSAVCGARLEERELFVNILPRDTIIILEEPGDIEEVANVYLDRVENPDRLYSWVDIYAGLGNFTQLHICRFATAAPGEFLKVDVKSVQRFQRKATSLWAGHKEALEQLVQEVKEGKKVLLYCEASAEIKRVGEIIREIAGKVPSGFELLLGFVNQGFVVDSLETIVISHHELFGQFALRRRQRPVRAGVPVDTLSDLQVGDYVVHLSYGIGKFLGIKTITEDGGPNEYLTIGYADGVKIQVSVRNIALVQKFIGASPKRPKLSKIGSKRWQKQKEKVAKSVRDLAGELLEVQAKRRMLGGVAFGADSAWQMEFEESFAYQKPQIFESHIFT
ncbi:Transcription-repair-coupling factor [subsurface metagenome]